MPQIFKLSGTGNQWRRSRPLWRNVNQGAASLELVMASAVSIPIAGGVLFLGFKICNYVFAALSGAISMPFI